MLLGTISAVDASNGLTLTLDGESSPTTKKYHYLASYEPAANDRVLVEEVGDSYVVLGKVIDATANSLKSIIDTRIDTQTAKYMTGFNIDNYGMKAKYHDGTYSNNVKILQSEGVWNRLHDDHTYPIVFYETGGNFYIAYAGGSWKKITTT